MSRHPKNTTHNPLTSPSNPEEAPTVFIPRLPSRKVLEEAPARAVRILRAVANRPEIAQLMKSVGYGPEDQEEGLRCLHATASQRTATAIVDPPPATKAIAKLKATLPPIFRRVQAALAHKHPAQEAFVFENLRGGHADDIVFEGATFFERLNELENSPDRKSTRKADHEALATLTKRGITKAVREEGEALVKTAEKMFDGMVEPQASALTDEQQALLNLHAWVQDWSESARSVTKNRSILIALGIGQRRSRSTPPPPPAAPVTTPPPPVVVNSPSIPAPPALPATGETSSESDPRRVA